MTDDNRPFFDGSQDDESVLDSLGNLPDGQYKVCLAEASKEMSKRSHGVGFVKCEFEVLDDQYLGRKIFQNLIFLHPSSPRAVEIGRARFKKICLSAGETDKIQDPSELYGKPFYLKMRNKMQRNGQTSFEIEDISKDPFPEVESESSKGPLDSDELEAIF